jgi:hypothetical protein
MLKRAHWFGLAALMLLPPIAAFSGGCQGTCATSDDCPDGQFCSLAPGICSTPRALGFCKPVPDTCPDVVSLVCGCDGKQYANSCKASKDAFQSVANTGACMVSCGGTGNLTCPTGSFCLFAAGGCGAASAEGVCTPTPSTCANAPPSPVCGCDGKTHTNQCEAELMGVSIASTGACQCGGPSAVKCETGKYCDYAVGTCANPNPAGKCAAPPTTCQPFSTSLVCGCDGKTYPSACVAAQAQVGLFSSASGCPCGGPAGTLCATDEYCDYGMIGKCQAPNAAGTCAPRPKTCSGGTTVCGCDGVTYANACDAAKGGTSVASNGACTAMPDAGTGDGGDAGDGG